MLSDVFGPHTACIRRLVVANENGKSRPSQCMDGEKVVLMQIQFYCGVELSLCRFNLR
jgi:hypothetical protein